LTPGFNFLHVYALLVTNHEHIGRGGSKVEIISQSLPIAPIYASRLTFVLALTNLASYASYLKCGDGRPITTLNRPTLSYTATV